MNKENNNKSTVVKRVLALVLDNIFLIIGILGLIIGNIWCFIVNQRLLHTSTNIVIIMLLVINFTKRK